MTHRLNIAALAAGLAAAATLTPAAARANLVTNGSFETTAAFTAPHHYLALTNNSVLNGWTSGLTDGNAVVEPGWQAAGCFYCSPGYPAASFSGALPASSPDGGNFVFSDANYHNSVIQQTISGLTPGAKYTLTFYDGLSEAAFTPANGLSGPITAHWNVSLGGPVQSTPTLSANGATGVNAPWTLRSLTFKAGAATEVLSFLAVAPAGDPPLLLLDGVTLDAAAVPEPGTLALMLAGAGVLALATRRARG